MKKSLIILLTFFSSFSFGQTTVDALFQKADSAFFDFKDYPKALDLYRQIEKQLTPTDKDWKYLVNKIARSLFFIESVNRKDSKKSIELSQQYIDFADKNKPYLDTIMYDKKFFMYKNMVVAYFALDQLDKAKIY